MIIAIAANDNSLEAPVSSSITTAACYVIANTATGELFALEPCEKTFASVRQMLVNRKVQRLYVGRLEVIEEAPLADAAIAVRRVTTKTVMQILNGMVSAGEIQQKPVAKPWLEPSIDPPQKGVTRLAVPADEGANLDASRSEHFGRCTSWILVDILQQQIQQVTEMDNPGHIEGGCSAVVEQLKARGVNTVLVNGIGASPFQAFHRSGIAVLKGVGETVRESIDAYLHQKLNPVDDNALCNHH